ncbi:MAG: ABC transporter ATP-binding protein [Cyanobacteria bacterium J06639_16]
MIEVEQLSKTYGSTEAIRDVTFGVEPGEILGFLGPNGAGKTTTMRILAGYLPATGGTARVANYEVHADSMAVRQRIGYLPESPPLYPEMTVEGFLHFVGRIKGVSAGDRPQQVTSAIERCGLVDKRTVLIRKLSKGYRQRVGIAQAIVHDPPVIILDEPTVGLDPRQIIEVRNLIKSLAGKHTIILSTHILPEVSMTCDRVTIINRGRIVATDSPEELTARLAGETTYEVEIQGDPRVAQQQLSTLTHINRVESIEESGSTDQSRHRFLVVAPSTVDPGRDIAAAVVQAGLGLFELKRDRVSLEDVFINLTGVDTLEPEGSDAESDDGDHAREIQPAESEVSVATMSDSGEADSEEADSAGGDSNPDKAQDLETITDQEPHQGEGS